MERIDAKKIEKLKALIEEGIQDLKAGRVKNGKKFLNI